MYVEAEDLMSMRLDLRHAVASEESVSYSLLLY